MENSKSLLENLKQQNKDLKKLIIETENEMEMLRKQSTEEVKNTKELIKSIVPSYARFVSNGREHKFTQFDEESDFNRPIVLLSGLDTLLSHTQDKLLEIQEQNKVLENEIGTRKLSFENLIKENEMKHKIIETMESEKCELMLEINNIQQKVKVLKEHDAGGTPLSILKAFE